jgi:GTP pyrophosphokinase
VVCEWARDIAGEVFKSTVDIYGKDREGLLLDVSIALNNMHVPVYSIIAREQPDDQTAIQIIFGITDLGQFQHVASSLGKIHGISRVERTVQ